MPVWEAHERRNVGVPISASRQGVGKAEEFRKHQAPTVGPGDKSAAGQGRGLCDGESVHPTLCWWCCPRHDFVVVETIEFLEDEDDELPPPMALREVIALNKTAALEEEDAAPDGAAPARDEDKGDEMEVRTGASQRRVVTALTVRHEGSGGPFWCEPSSAWLVRERGRTRGRF
jgi:Pre-mRNA splicing factor PRP21 like protein